jgi:hypothetical protein
MLNAQNWPESANWSTVQMTILGELKIGGE